MGMRSSLFISNVDGAQGLYTCMATNAYGSEMSSPGELKIKGKNFFFSECWSATCFRLNRVFVFLVEFRPHHQYSKFGKKRSHMKKKKRF